MKRWSILLETGAVIFDWSTRDEAKAAKARWNRARQAALAGPRIAVPRLAIGLVRFKPRKKAAAQSEGGRARAAKLSPKRRREIAQKAAKARWGAKS